MSSTPTFSFIGEQKLSGDSISKLLCNNIKTWIDISFVRTGGYDTVSLNEPAYDGTDLSALTPIDDRVYGQGYVYQSYFKNWIWENDIPEEGMTEPPVVCSGIWVGGDFYPREASGDMAYHVDYRNGRIIFDMWMAPDQVYGSGNVEVTASFSYKRVYVASDYELKQTIENISKYANNPIGSGENILDESKIPLPAVIVQEMSHSWDGYQLGGYKKCNHIVSATIFSARSIDGENIVDMLSQQENKKVPTIDWNDSETCFDEYGDVNASFSGVFESQSIYPWKDIYINETEGRKDKKGVYAGKVTFYIETSPHM